MRDPLFSVSNDLRHAINTCGQNRYAICKALRIPQSNLSRFMSGRGGLSLERIDRLAVHLGLKLFAVSYGRRGERWP
jgi:plasmid maintenance system antidote protein VapI